MATDLIVGFPGEGDDDYRKTYEAVGLTEFGSIHVFKYSVRSGTAAGLLEDDVPHRVKSHRSRHLIELGKQLNYNFRSRFVNGVREAVFENHGGKLQGLTDNYIRVSIDRNLDSSRLRWDMHTIVHRCAPVKITAVTGDRTTGEITGRKE
jgi:threonylcarbamoyladenosine tRNA methylthiotransferase MtaB